MAKIKHTKTELKAQRDSLKRYERYLPMLQLKKQQLQAEIQRISALYDEKAEAARGVVDATRNWVKLLSEPFDFSELISVTEILTEEGNIAGVAIPVFKDVVFDREAPDLFETPAWVDDAVTVVESLARLQAERDVLDDQRRLIGEELRVTSQRVNLFEKVKIPECRENIRVIKIFLGDEQTAAVARGKIAKRRTSSQPAEADQADNLQVAMS